jgi:Fur family transcriptional regulator, peroxide stress response regulator
VERRTEVAGFEAVCRKHRLPMTIQRRAIYEFVSQRKDHPTADQVCEGVQDRIPDVSRMTVYRVLGTLIKIGALRKVCSPGSTARFDASMDRHHHIVCVRCDKLVDHEDATLNDLPLPDARSRGFEVNDYSILFRAICADCRKKSARPGGRKRGLKIDRKHGRKGSQ